MCAALADEEALREGKLQSLRRAVQLHQQRLGLRFQHHNGAQRLSLMRSMGSCTRAAFLQRGRGDLQAQLLYLEWNPAQQLFLELKLIQ